MSRVLVTGATGFLGRRVVRRLAATATVTAHGRTTATSPFAHEVEYLQGELDGALLGTWRWDAVVHLAGPVTGGAEDLATGIDVVAEHARLALAIRHYAAGARIVHASSMTVYGAPQAQPIVEDHPRKPAHLYGLAKLVAEDILLTDPSLDACVLRFPGLFAEDRRSGALYHFCRAARRHEPLRVTTARPTPWDVLHADDAAEAVALALAVPTRGAFNISYGEPIELVAIAREIAARAGAPVETNGVTHPVLQLDIARARAHLSWSPPSLTARVAALYDAYASEDA